MGATSDKDHEGPASAFTAPPPTHLPTPLSRVRQQSPLRPIEVGLGRAEVVGDPVHLEHHQDEQHHLDKNTSRPPSSMTSSGRRIEGRKQVSRSRQHEVRMEMAEEVREVSGGARKVE